MLALAPAGDARLALFSLAGFRPELERAVAQRSDILLVSLPARYGQAPVSGGS